MGVSAALSLPSNEELIPPGSVVFGLRSGCGSDWHRYTAHPFVMQLANGSLPEECFRHYLIQDYLFLIHFARAYALAAYKSDNLADIRQATGGLSAIVDVEMDLHVKFCEGWGISQSDMENTPEASATIAYTRFVLERGMSGDLLDLHIALAPCIIGYADIARNLMADPATQLEGNPYRDWIEMYASEEYQEVAISECAFIDDLASRMSAPGQVKSRFETFRQATRLEGDFWDMGLNLER